jgi:hypothetical protein
MRRWGGCGIIPSGTYFSEAPTSVLNVEGKVDGHAIDLLPEMVTRNALVPEVLGEASGQKRRRNGHGS